VRESNSGTELGYVSPRAVLLFIDGARRAMFIELAFGVPEQTFRSRGVRMAIRFWRFGDPPELETGYGFDNEQPDVSGWEGFLTRGPEGALFGFTGEV